MMPDRDGLAVAGGLVRHVPVLARAAIEHLQPRDGGVYLDGTFGAGGYSRMLLQAANTTVIALDRDQTAVSAAAPLVEQANGRLTVVESPFSELAEVAERHSHAQLDGVVLDLGVSSMQLDQAERGFSFRFDGPLDMRMAQHGPTAADLVAEADESDLADIIYHLGEERRSRAVARAIVAARRDSPIKTTAQLASIVGRVVHSKPGQVHPATRTFQALRMFVNDELGELARGLVAAERVLKPSGRLVVVTFHSLEDRLVKTFMVERSRTAAGSRHRPEVEAPALTFELVTRRPVAPDDAEIEANPRARSAKLRAAARTEAPPRGADIDALLPPLPALSDIVRGA